MRVRWTAPATRDLQVLGAYIAEKNPAAAARVTAAIRRRVESLRHFANGRIGRVHGTYEVVVTGTPYVVAYLLRDTAIDILTVRHGSQLWPEAFVAAMHDSADGE